MATTITLRLDDTQEETLNELKHYFRHKTASKALIDAMDMYKARDMALHEKIEELRRMVDKHNTLISYMKMRDEYQNKINQLIAE